MSSAHLRAAPRKHARLPLAPLAEQAAGWLTALLVAFSLVLAVLLFFWWALPQRWSAAPMAPSILLDEGGSPLGQSAVPTAALGPDAEETTEAVEEAAAPLETIALALVATAAQLPEDRLEALAIEEAASQLDPAASSTGASGQALGEGDRGGQGVPRGMRWMIRYPHGIAAEEYARQLDFFEVELGHLVGNDEVQYASGFSTLPRRRTGLRTAELRLYFTWRDGRLSELDRQLWRRAGLHTTGRGLLHFYPSQVEQQLAERELAYLRQHQPQRSLRHVRRTIFEIRSNATGYEFFVADQKCF